MKAALIQAPGRLTLENLPVPVAGDYEVVCELLWGTICSGTDSHILDGSFPWIGPLPTVPGHESIGRVIEIGPKVRHYRVGDLVTRVGMPPRPDLGISVTWGGFAEYGIAKDHWAMAADGMPASQWEAFRVHQILPTGIDPRIAPLFITWRETYSYLLRRGIRPGHSVLIVGSGGNGLSFACHAANEGVDPLVMIGSPRLREMAETRVGVSHYLDYRSPDLGERLREIRPEGFDFILDAIGKREMMESLLPHLKPWGHYALYGLDDYGHFQLNPLRSRHPFTLHPPGDYDEAETHQRVSEACLSGRLDPTLWLDTETGFTLDTLAEAFQAVRERRTLKALVRLCGSVAEGLPTFSS